MGARQCLMMRIRTEDLKATVSVCTSCIVDNKCEFQHSHSSHDDCNFDARLVG